MKLEIRMLTCMDKVFLDEAPQASEPVYQGFQNERIDFQVAFRAQDTRWTEVEVHLHGPLQAYARVRQVMHVPVRYAMPEEEKESCLRYAPGLYPDLLSEIRPHALHARKPEIIIEKFALMLSNRSPLILNLHQLFRLP